MFYAVRIVAGGGTVTAIFDPVEKGFDRLVNIVRGAKNSVVFLEICGGDVGVGGVQVIQDVAVVVRPYTTYVCQKERMNISSTVERRIFWRDLSVQSYSLKSAEAVSKASPLCFRHPPMLIHHDVHC